MEHWWQNLDWIGLNFRCNFLYRTSFLSSAIITFHILDFFQTLLFIYNLIIKCLALPLQPSRAKLTCQHYRQIEIFTITEHHTWFLSAWSKLHHPSEKSSDKMMSVKFWINFISFAEIRSLITCLICCGLQINQDMSQAQTELMIVC